MAEQWTLADERAVCSIHFTRAINAVFTHWQCEFPGFSGSRKHSPITSVRVLVLKASDGPRRFRERRPKAIGLWVVIRITSAGPPHSYAFYSLAMVIRESGTCNIVITTFLCRNRLALIRSKTCLMINHQNDVLNHSAFWWITLSSLLLRYDA